MKSLLLHSLILCSIWFSALRAEAYPEFVGYGYSSCLTCHNNGMGGGSINDYGRGLWAAELSSRLLYPKDKKLETLSESSGFLGNPEALPWWLRPHMKYRGVWVQRNPGSSTGTQKFYQMQLDLGAAIILDPEQKYLFNFTMGYVPSPQSVLENSVNRILPRDYYLRVQASEPLWLYFGKMEKVFGLRNVDHTSYTRAPLELTQNAQSHGAIVHWVNENYELAGNLFVGDLASLTPKAEQKGLSLWSEFEVERHMRWGFSALSSKNEQEKSLQILATHWRQALSKGSAIMLEYGLLQKMDKGLGTAANGSYTFVESMVLLEQGYHLLINLERYNADAAARSPEQWKYGLGLLAFPINRLELRMNAVHYRQVSAEEATPDAWALQGQIHVSL